MLESEGVGLRQAVVWLLLTALVPAATPLAAPAPGPLSGGASVASLTADTTEHDLYLSFSLEGAFSDETREEIATGLPVTFTYELELARRRPLWFDKTLVRRTIATTVTYDTLTHQYRLSKRVNDEVAESSVAVNEADMMRWMTHLERVRLADPTILDDPLDDSLYVRVRSRIRKRFILFFIPWNVDTGWEKLRLNLPGEGTARDR